LAGFAKAGKETFWVENGKAAFSSDFQGSAA